VGRAEIWKVREDCLLDGRGTPGVSTGVAALPLSQTLLPTFLRFQHRALLFFSIGAGGHSGVLYFTLERFRRLRAIVGGRAGRPSLSPALSAARRA